MYKSLTNLLREASSTEQSPIRRAVKQQEFA